MNLDMSALEKRSIDLSRHSTCTPPEGSWNALKDAYEREDEGAIGKANLGTNLHNLGINEIGPYQGARPLSGREPVMFDIKADGSWTVRIEPIGHADSAAFSGRGDGVSGLFDPPGMGPWQIKHNGQANFIVYSHCAGGSDLLQNEIDMVDGSRVVRFSRGLEAGKSGLMGIGAWLHGDPQPVDLEVGPSKRCQRKASLSFVPGTSRSASVRPSPR